MCTIVLAFRYLPDAPIVLAVNRDERYDRPAQPPRRIEGTPGAVAPIDLEAGGTWVGVTEDGLVAAIANRPDGPTGDRSRGDLVQTALQAKTAMEARTRLRRALESGSYAGCYLLVADERAAFVLEWDGRVGVHPLDAGIHVLVNAGLDDPPKAQLVRQRLLEASPTDLDAWRATVAQLMADHEVGTCVHGDDAGTRSSSIITVGRMAIAYAFADGPPCRTGYQDVWKWEP